MKRQRYKTPSTEKKQNFQHDFIMSEKQLREICNETFVVGFILQERVQFVL